MVHPVRAVFTLLGVATAGFLIWLSTQFGTSLSAYWAKIGLLAAAGLALPLSQLFGGWTKWGWPRFSPHVLLVGVLPALVVAGWVILSGQPDANWFQRHVTSWSNDLHVARLVRHLRETYLDVLAFGLGTVFGFSFDTTGPRIAKSEARTDDAVTTVSAPAAPVSTPAEPAAEPPVRVSGPGEGASGEPGGSPANPEAETHVTGPSTVESAETRVTPSEERPPDA